MRTLFLLLLVISTICLSSCQHQGVTIRETPIGLTEIRRVVMTVVGDPRKSSANGYEMDSAFYDRKERPIERPNEVRERLFTRVQILGDRRPYDINVQVFVDIRTPEGYETLGHDDNLAAIWADRIKKALHESRDKRNIIDDFKAF